MYIIRSKENKSDYYDVVAKTTGIDKTLIYKRETITIPKSEYSNKIQEKYFHREKWSHYVTHISPLSTVVKYRREMSGGLSLIVVGFCGKLYPIFKTLFFDNYPYDPKYFNLNQINELKEYCLTKSGTSSWFSRFEYQKVCDFDQIHDNAKAINEQEWLEPFVDMKTPIIAFIFGKDNNIIVNDNLSRYNFEKLVDPYTAWQSIYQFIDSTIPRQDREIITISDKDRIAGHGFDKWSFRKKVR